MEIEERQDGNYCYVVINLGKERDFELINKIKTKAEEDSKKVNPSYLDGSICNKDLKYFNNLGGVLAEESVKQYILYLFDNLGVKGEILEEPFVNHKDHRDIKLKINGKIITLEIRSSFNYLTFLKNVLEGKFSLLASYTTSYKGEEPKKDFYITVIHRYKNDEIINKLEDNVEVFIIGGASEKTFQEKGELNKSKLKQKGAEYFIISPIKSVPDVPALFKEILLKNGK